MNNINILKKLKIITFEKYESFLNSKILFLIENKNNSFTIVLESNNLWSISEIKDFLEIAKYDIFSFDLKINVLNKKISFIQIKEYIDLILNINKKDFKSPFFKSLLDNNDLNKYQKYFKFENDNIILDININDELISEIIKNKTNFDILFIENNLKKFGINIPIKVNYISNLNQKNIDINLIKNKEKIISNNNQVSNFYFENLMTKINFNNIEILRKNGKKDDIVRMKAEIFQIEKKDIIAKKNNKKFIIYNFYLTDKTESILLNIFIVKTGAYQKQEMFYDSFKITDLIYFSGKYNYNDYSKWHINLNSYEKESIIKLSNVKIQTIEDNSTKKRIELHNHTKMSTMDGIVNGKDYLKRAYDFGHKAIAITDFCNIQAFPELHNEYIKNYQNKDFKLIYGSEFNMINKKINYVFNSNNDNLYQKKYVIFDLETTGLSPYNSEIIEFGAVIFDPKTNDIKSIDILIKPSIKLSDFTKSLTHLSDELLEKEGITIEEAMKKILVIFDDAILVAHNAIFDLSFMNFWLNKLNYPTLKNAVIDTLPLSQSIWNNRKSYTLKNLCKFNKIEYNTSDAHRADYDANVLCSLFIIILEKLKNININSKILTVSDLDKMDNNSINVYDKMYGLTFTVLVQNKIGLFNLFKLISISHTSSFFNSPKIFKDSIKENREGLLLGTGLINSELFNYVLNKTDLEIEQIISFYDYIEIQPPSLFTHLIQKNELTEDFVILKLKKIITLSLKLKKIIIATGTSRYLDKNQSISHEIFINAKRINGKLHPLFDLKNRIKKYPIYDFKTTNQMKKEFSFLNDPQLIDDIVVNNTHLINEKIEQVYPIKEKLYTPEIQNCENKLRQLCYNNAINKYGQNLPQIVSDRLNHELDSIIKHGYAVIYWISHKLVKKSNDEGYLVGSRGSVGSSLAATLSNITEINPLKPHYICNKCCYSNFDNTSNVKSGYDLKPIPCPKCQTIMYGDGHDIPFETFLGFEANKVPDIDLNFSSDYQHKAHNFIKEMFGEKNVLRAGTISTVAAKTAYGYVKAFLETKNIEKSQIEIARLAKECEGVKRTTGQHPGGIIIIPNNFDVNDFTPTNYPADDINSSWKTSHFDFHAIHNNVLKLDILGHIDPTALKFLHNITGINPETIPIYDLDVLNLFSSNKNLNFENKNISNSQETGALGIPEFGTKFVREMLKITRPKSFSELVQISGLSHGTNVWIDNANNLIKEQNIPFSEVISCRDDIMTYLISKNIDPLIAFNIMESVRKGNNIPSQYIQLLEENKNIPEWYISSCNKIKYMFPKAHATAYVLMAWRIAWYKLNYPVEYYATFFTNRTEVFDIKTIIKGSDAIKEKLLIINQKVEDKTADQKEKDLQIVYEVALEMWDRGIEITNLNLILSSDKDFTVHIINGKKIIIPPFTAIDGLGTTISSSIIQERNKRSDKKFISIEDFKNNTSITKTHLNILEELGVLNTLELNNQLQIKF